MNESLIQQYFLNDDGLYGCKILSLNYDNDNLKEVESWLNLVPAAAVRREGQALFGITGRKEFVDCIIS